MKITSLVIASLICLQSVAQTILLDQNFNNGFPAGWQMLDDDGLAPNSNAAVNFITEAFIVAEDLDSTGIGDSVLISTSWHEEEGTANNFLILPSLTMGTFGNYISFDAKSLDASYPEEIEVRISKGGINAWDFFVEPSAYSNEAISPYWTNYTVSLDSANAAGEDVFISIRHTGSDNYILALDNIKVWKEDPVGINSISNSSILITPNPARDFINTNIESNKSYTILDIAGKQVQLGTTTSSSISIETLNQGIYFLNVSGHVSEKFIKN